MGKHYAIAVGAGLALMVGIAAWSAEPDIKYGEWEITTTMEGGMMPQPMTFTTRQCLTKENYLPQGSPEGKQPCTVKQMSVKGSTVQWAMECPDEAGGTVSGQGEITYRETSYEGMMRMTMQMEGRPVTMTQRLQGRRLGECR
jgi:hypothetical protein